MVLFLSSFSSRFKVLVLVVQQYQFMACEAVSADGHSANPGDVDVDKR